MSKKKLSNDDLDLGNDFSNDFGEMDSFGVDWKPQDMSFDTFKLRNDPSNLLKTIKYMLMSVEESLDKETNKVIIIKKVNPLTKEEVRPLVNQQGVEEIMLVLHPIINNHNVMGNMSSELVHTKKMRFISDDLTVYFWTKQEDWGLSIDYVNPIILFLSTQIDLFLSRTIGDLERSHYGESFKETREVKPMVHEKKNFLSNIGGMFRGR